MASSSNVSTAATPAAVSGRIPEITALLARVGTLLEAGEPRKALEALAGSRLASPWIVNARGVCLLRLEEFPQAINCFRGLVLAEGLVIREDCPTVFKANYAVALLASDNVPGFLGVLEEMANDTGSHAEKLRESLRHYKNGLSLWKKILWALGNYPSRPPIVPAPFGELE